LWSKRTWLSCRSAAVTEAMPCEIDWMGLRIPATHQASLRVSTPRLKTKIYAMICHGRLV